VPWQNSQEKSTNCRNPAIFKNIKRQKIKRKNRQGTEKSNRQTGSKYICAKDYFRNPCQVKNACGSIIAKFVKRQRQKISDRIPQVKN